MTRYCSKNCPRIYIDKREHGENGFCDSMAVFAPTLAADNHGWICDPDCPYDDKTLTTFDVEAVEDRMHDAFDPIADFIIVECIVGDAHFTDGVLIDMKTKTETINMDHIVSAKTRRVGVGWTGRNIKIEPRLVLCLSDKSHHTIDASMADWVSLLTWKSNDPNFGYAS